ncbi:hypothetical protein TSUD_359090 [Trifolium subterraneum]|uniref:CCAAT-binding factor domain-containing protein n=1 Tax=Trifolium subterraneum TaxID=3900 RepID=A0A2Z6MQJ5_TRISU|nr:hypothetical protein TSUD_359090 [Trifolium subterraneum]
MAKSNSDKPSKNIEDINLLQSEVASFASSLGLSTSQPNSGFNDVDFRKTKPKKTPEKTTSQNTQKPKNKTFSKNNEPHEKPKSKPEPKQKPNSKPEPKPKPPVLSLKDGNKDKGYNNKFKNLPKLPLIKANALGVWFEDADELEGKVIGEGKKVEMKNLDEWKRFVEKKRELGERLMAQFAQDYESTRGRSGDIKMLISTQRSGTAADKVSAFSVLVGDNPVANLRSLDALLGDVLSLDSSPSLMCSRLEPLMAFIVYSRNGDIQGWKASCLVSLLPDRKLKTLMQRPLNHIPENKDGYSLLLFWYWEECLKQRYERFIGALEEASRDMLPALKNKYERFIGALEEASRDMLPALKNKSLKAVVVNEVDTFLFRPHLSPRSQYHAVNFLSQIRLTNKGDGPKVAKRLIDVYFGLFKVLITGPSSNEKNDKHGKENPKEKNSEGHSDSHAEMDSRLLSVLLTGVNRAFPFVSSNEADDIVDVQTPVLFQLVHSKNFNVGVQALMLLDKISSKNQIASDRFYRALLHFSNHHNMPVHAFSFCLNSLKPDHHYGQKSQESIKKPLLPGGYDPRHREPSYCNADHVSWWELLVLASHAHPSVSTMARTLLSGANIVYNGNPLSDLSLTAFLDKFMEKKPKQSTWHGGSQIEPVKQLDVNNLLVGSEILALAEADVPPEDLVFHKFYTNKKSSSSKPKKKKKKSTDDEDVDDYFGADADDVDGGDESDNEEIEDLLDSADPTLGPDGDFDYDDLDKVANEDDDDLIGDDVSDADIDIDIPSDIELDDADDTPFADDDSDDNNDIQIGDMDDASDDVEDHQVDKRKRKRKTGGKGVSPFASYEEFEHILEDDDATEKKPSKDKNKSKRKKMEDDEPTEKKPSKDKNKSKKRKKKSAQ